MALNGLKLKHVRRRWVLSGLAALVVLPGIILHADNAAPLPVDKVQIDLQQLVSGLKNPVFVSGANDGSNRLFVVEQPGRIQLVQNGQLAAAPFLDITSIVASDALERGLLSVAFSPDYKQSGVFYVYYTGSGGTVTIARYKVSSDPNVADPESGKIVLAIPHPEPNHNGGQLAFGPDGFLYAGIGDGGSEYDPNHYGQNVLVLYGKMLRLDVSKGNTYAVPIDNPFATNGQGRPEIWAFGLRNPWRFSFDRKTNDLYIGDVGQDKYEEIDVQRAGTGGGANYGWSIMEGLHCFNPSNGCNQNGLVLPVYEYDHSQGCAIVGGYVYRGQAIPDFDGTYFFGDDCSGRIWAMQLQADSTWKVVQVAQSSFRIGSFGQDDNGELYVTDLGSGTVSHIVEKK